MRKSKVLAAALCAVLMLSLLRVGGQKKDDLAKIKDAGKIVWGTNAEFMPFETKDRDGNVIGIDQEIAQKIADRLGVELQVEDMEFDSLPAALDSGKIDFIAAGYSKDAEREKSMDFSDPYFTAAQVVMVREDSDIKTKEDLVGKQLGVQNGTTGDVKVASLIEGAEVARHSSLMLAAQDLKNGKIDAVIGDNLPSMMIINNIEGLKILDDIKYEDEDYSVAVRKGQEGLLKEINAVLKEMIDNGEIDAAREKYFTME